MREAKLRPRRVGVGAAALVAAALALPAAPARAVDPDALPEAVWWRSTPQPALAAAPLEAIGTLPRLSLSSEWAPLYSGPDGGRLQFEQRALRIASPPGRYRLAVEAREGGGVARGGASGWWVGAERPIEERYVVALAAFGTRVDAAGAFSENRGRPGYAFDARWKAAPGFALGAGASRAELAGRALMRWEDTEVAADGNWRDDAAHASLVLGSNDRVGLAATAAWLERGSLGFGPVDGLAPHLWWRTGEVALSGRALESWWRASFAVGEGEEEFQVLRSSTPYLVLAGPVSSRLVDVALEPGQAPVVLRAWAGSWRGAARGSLALWPFDAAAAVSATRRIAHSQGALDHWGLSVDLGRRASSRADAGLALWSLAPRASYDSWQGTWFGLGRDDLSSGATDLHSVLALGARLGLAADLFGARYRAEVVQWVPVRAEREGGGSRQATGGVGSAGGAATSGGARGGTILRLTIETIAR